MKLRRCTIERFKKFEPPGIELCFRNRATGETADRYLLLGDNASGKTTILQAIALTLSLAQHKIPDVQHFGWTGFAPDRLLVHGDPHVELEVEFSTDEIAATREAARLWWKHTGRGGGFVEPGDALTVTLHLEGTNVRAIGGLPALYQFQGRSYAAAIAARDPRARALFPRLPGVFWYDQFRNVALSGARAREEPTREDQRPQQPDGELTFTTSVERLDGILKAWHGFRVGKRPHPENDPLGQIEQHYSSLFPGRSFAGVEPTFGAGPTPEGDRFVLTDGKHTYALCEMSAGEQAVFPLLFDFVRRQIHRCVVLVDEMDLNLHPPLAQAFLGMLPRLGNDNQFLFTTHSRAVANLVSPHTIHRLPEGHPCL